MATKRDDEASAWVREFLEEHSKLGDSVKSVVERFAKDQRIILVPNAKLRRGQRWPNPSLADVPDAGDEASLGDGVAKALSRSVSEVVRQKPPRDRGGVIDRESHALIGVSAKHGFFRKMNYGQIVLKDGCAVFYPPRQGALCTDLPLFEAQIGEPHILAPCLRKTMEATI